MSKAIIVLFALLVTACGTTPRSDYYVLTATNEDATTEQAAYTLGVGPINIAPWLDRDPITLKEGNALVIDEFSRWGEPLHDGVVRVLTENFNRLLGSGQVVSFPWRADDIPDYRLKLKVVDLNRTGSQAELVAEWSLERTGAEVLERDQTRLTITAEDQSYDALAAAYSELLGQLSQQLAVRLASHFSQ